MYNLIILSRGSIDPLCVCEEPEKTESESLEMKNMVTIVINKEKGVWARM